MYRRRQGIYRAIQSLRRDLDALTAHRPLSDPEVVGVSRRLDGLVLQLMREQGVGERRRLERV